VVLKALRVSVLGTLRPRRHLRVTEPIRCARTRTVRSWIRHHIHPFGHPSDKTTTLTSSCRDLVRLRHSAGRLFIVGRGTRGSRSTLIRPVLALGVVLRRIRHDVGGLILAGGRDRCRLNLVVIVHVFGVPSQRKEQSSALATQGCQTAPELNRRGPTELQACIEFPGFGSLTVLTSGHEVGREIVAQ